MKKEILGYEGLYAVDENGTVWSMRGKPKKMKAQVSTGGYLKVMLYRGEERKWAYVHRLVAGAFLPRGVGQNVVNHIDANPQNNNAANLEWVSQIENIAFSRKLGNQNKDRAVRVTSASGSSFYYRNMREAPIRLFGGSEILRGQFRRKGPKFKYRGFAIEIGLPGAGGEG